MSELSLALELFGFTNIEDVTPDTLKKAFKMNVVKIHPDRSGDSELFDNMLQAYIYLTSICQRISGGRSTLQSIISPDELKGVRSDELISQLFEELTIDDFNKRFEESHNTESHGYSSWLKNTDCSDNYIKIEQEDLNKVFENSLKMAKPVSSTLIVHPEAMAYVSATMSGTSIVETNQGPYTSDVFTNPTYTDLYSAYTTENTVYDKLTDYIEKPMDLDSILSERNKEIQPLNDDELKAIQDFEKNKATNTILQFSKLNEHYTCESSGGFIHNF